VYKECRQQVRLSQCGYVWGVKKAVNTTNAKDRINLIASRNRARVNSRIVAGKMGVKRVNGHGAERRGG